MLPLRTAARLLADAASLDALLPLAATLGCAGRAAPVEPALLDWPADRAAPRLQVRRGPGGLRALLVETADAEPLREAVARLARALARRSPHPLWCIVATAPATHETIVAAWAPAAGRPRIAALSVDRRRVVASDADTLRALHAAALADGPARDLLAHAAWLDLLGREALCRRFYRELEDVVATVAAEVRARARLDAEERRELALLQLSRLLFLSFLEAKGWLDGDRAFLARQFERCGGEALHRRLLRPLFFGTLNTPVARRAAAARAFGRVPFLNGGLFAPTPLERRARDATVPDAALALLFDRLLARYRFTAREDAAAWSDAAVDPEMLGRAFESLMHAGARRASGAFYTPQLLVAHATATALATALADPALGLDADAAAAIVRGAAPPAALAPALRRRLLALRVCDPACGSGAFLVHALETVADLARRAGDPRPASAVRRSLLAGGIFGVDVNPMAVWLCELRLWLSAVIDEEADDPLRVAPLPNLDRNVRVGDALAGGGFDAAGEGVAPARRPAAAASAAGAAELARLRLRYARSAGAAKRALARRLDRLERDAALRALDAALARAGAARRDLQAALRGRDLFGERGASAAARRELARWRDEARRLRARRRAVVDGAGLPFAFATHFPDVAPRGFDLVVGNPPWVRPHHLPPAARAALREAFVVARRAAWEAGARAGGAGRGFAGQVDLAAPFVERALTVLRPGGTLALLLPAKLWRTLAGGGVRALVAGRCRLAALEDWSRAPAAFDAAVYPSLLVAARLPAPPPTAAPCASPAGARWASAAPAALVDHDGHGAARWTASPPTLSLDPAADAPWLLVPPAVRAAFDALRAAGTPLAASPVGRPLPGVKCGCNDAFFVAPDGAAAAGDGRPAARDVVEAALLRPVVRGESLAPWRLRDDGARIVWTHDALGAPLPVLPRGAAHWLAPARRRLERRSDARGGGPWWALFRTAAALHDRPRVAWPDVARAPRAAFLPAGDPTVPLNSCYVVRCRDAEDALALTALLNAPPLAAWLSLVAEPARGGYRRHLAWTMALLPLPRDWVAARGPLARLAERACGGAPVEDAALSAAALAAYGVPPAAVAPLLAWAAR